MSYFKCLFLLPSQALEAKMYFCFCVETWSILNSFPNHFHELLLLFLVTILKQLCGVSVVFPWPVCLGSVEYSTVFFCDRDVWYSFWAPRRALKGAWGPTDVVKSGLSFFLITLYQSGEMFIKKNILIFSLYGTCCEQEKMSLLQKGLQPYATRVSSQESLCLYCPIQTTLWVIL